MKSYSKALHSKIPLLKHFNYVSVSLNSVFIYIFQFLFQIGPELVSWEENENKDGSWEEAESWDASKLVREKRRAEREKLAALKRDHGRSLLGSKVS